MFLLLDRQLSHDLLQQFGGLVAQHFVVEAVQFLHGLVLGEVLDGPVADDQVQLAHAEVAGAPGELVAEGVDLGLEGGELGDGEAGVPEGAGKAVHAMGWVQNIYNRDQKCRMENEIDAEIGELRKKCESQEQSVMRMEKQMEKVQVEFERVQSQVQQLRERIKDQLNEDQDEQVVLLKKEVLGLKQQRDHHQLQIDSLLSRILEQKEKKHQRHIIAEENHRTQAIFNQMAQQGSLRAQMLALRRTKKKLTNNLYDLIKSISSADQQTPKQ